MSQKFTRKGRKLKKFTAIAALSCMTLMATDGLAQEIWNFSPAGATGRFGPTQAQINTAYAGTNLEGNVVIETQGIQEWIVPVSGPYLIESFGAQGGISGTIAGGLGAKMSGVLVLNAGDVLSLVVGQQGAGIEGATGGGGASFVTLGANHLTSVALVVAGGGSGTGGNSPGNPGLTSVLSGAGDNCLAGVSNGNGGNSGETCGGGSGGAGGFNTDGQGLTGWQIQRGFGFRNGAAGGYSATENSYGGFGGGAGTHNNNTGGGAGGGYSGGSASFHDGNYNGGGGGSYNSGLEQQNLAGVNNGHGKIAITLLYSAEISQSADISCIGAADGALEAKVNFGTPPYTFEWSNGFISHSGDPIAGYTLMGHIYEHSYYKRNGVIGSFAAASAEAKNNFGYIVSVNSASENAWLYSNGAQINNFIGLTDAAVEGTFVWDSGEPLIYSNFTAGEPNNAGDEDFVHIRADGLWNDIAWQTDAASKVPLIELPGVSKISGLVAGSYTVTITDSEGLVAVASFELLDPAPISIDFDITASGTCSETGNGTAQANVSGGTAPYTYAWSTGENVDNISGKAIGNYDLTVTDANNCPSVTDSASINLNDNTAPVTITKPATIYLNANGEASLSVADIDSGSSDDCMIAEMNISKSNFTCADSEEQSITLTVSDASGNESSAQALVQVLDTISPVLETINVQLSLGANGLASVNVSAVNDGTTDNCAISSMALSKSVFSCADLGVNEVIFSANDFSGNTRSKTVIITIVDQIAPVVITQDVTIYLNGAGEATLTALLADGGSTDNCGIASRALSKTLFTCEDLGTNTVNLQVSDASGNADETTFTVTVADEIAPVVNEVALTYYLDQNGQAVVSTDDFIGFATDNCELASVSGMAGTYDCTQIGIVSGNLSFFDVSGNETAAAATLNILDTISPTLELTSIELILDASGTIVLTQEMLMPYVTENCGINEIAIENQNYSCVQYGMELYTEVLVIDQSANFVQKTVQVILIDQMAPVIEVADVTVNLNENGEAVISPDMLEIAITDNCDNHNLVFDQEVFACTQMGINVVTVTATDAAGYAGTTSFEVNVIDAIAPTIDAPENLTFCVGIPVSYEAVSAADNCSATIEVVNGLLEGETPEPGEYMVEFTATDPSGNATTAFVIVDVSANHLVDLGEDQVVAEGTTVTLVGGTDVGNTYIWSTGETSSVIELEVNEMMVVSVTVISAAGCRDVDEVVLSVEESVGVNTVDNGNGVRFYPNPTNGVLHAGFDLANDVSDVSLTVFDMTGKQVYQQQLVSLSNGSIVEMDMRNLKSGIYIIQLQGGELNLSNRFVKL